MVPVHDLGLFLAAALLLNLTPGPDMLYVGGTAAARGTRAGLAAALGIGAGCGVHVALGAVGVSALIASSPLAFTVLKIAGAGYLVAIGVSMLWRRRGTRRDVPGAAPAAAVGPATRDEASSPADAWGAFRQGVWVNALNPKVALFFLALLPQFIVPSAPGQAWAFVVLGGLFTVGGTVVNLGVAAGAGALRRRWAGRPGAGRLAAWLDRAAGTLFVLLGLRLAFGAR